jgi:hypothetical protein
MARITTTTRAKKKKENQQIVFFVFIMRSSVEFSIHISTRQRNEENFLNEIFFSFYLPSNMREADLV